MLHKTWPVIACEGDLVLKKLQTQRGRQRDVSGLTVTPAQPASGPPDVPTPRNTEAKRDISVLYKNARSLLPKRDMLLDYIDVENPDIIAITETWATADHLLIEYSAPGYESFFKNSLNKKGGGVICYVKNTLPAMKIKKTRLISMTRFILNYKPASVTS